MMARLLREPHTGVDQDLFALLDVNQIIVPSHWPAEIANALSTNIRRRRIAQSDIDAIVSFLANIQVTVASPMKIDDIGALTSFAVAQGLTAYDAVYVRVALEHGARLATVDVDMRAAAQRLDIPLLPS